MRIEVLGSLQVRGNGVTEPTRASHRRLLALLALESGHRIGTERLIDMYWGESPPTEAKAALQTHISALRRLLKPELIRTEGHGYRLSLDAAHLDAVEFDAAAAATRGAVAEQDWQAAVEAAAAALAMWRGTPYTELQDDDFARAEIARLEETHLELWEMWAESLLALGRPTEALPELERLVVRHPYRERLWEHLMTARYRLGRHAEALRAYRLLNDHLAEIGVQPGPSIRRLEEKILLHHEELTAPLHNLPAALTSFIGRESELRDVAKLLEGHRLVTLTGVGGSGKTRLAIEAARDLLGSFPDGCWLVGLADLRDPELIPVEISRVLRLAMADEEHLQALATSLRHDRMLVVLDNCEHLLDGAARVVERLLGSGDALKVLATTREPLHLPGEVVYEVPPLTSPPEDVVPADASGYDAVRLFVDRAALLDPHLGSDDESYSLIGSICRRLDGIPLAIELAAAKVRSFSLESIDRLLGEQVLSLTGGAAGALPRHRTLEAALAWSHDLLETAEQRVFARLAVFRGGFDIDMLQKVVADPDDRSDTAIRHLESLVDKSLVARDRTTPDRYRLLEPVREYAVQRLRASGEEAEMRSRHLDWCVRFASDVGARVYGSGRHRLLTRLGLEIENLDDGLEHAIDRSDPPAICAIASAMAWHWIDIGSATRGRDALDLAIANIDEDDHRRGELLSRAAQAHWILADTTRALDQAIQARDSVRDLPPSAQKAAALSRLAGLHSLLIDQDPRGGIDLAREAVAVAEATGDRLVVVQRRMSLGSALAWAGEVDEGLEMLRLALADAPRAEDPMTTIQVYNHLFSALYLHPQRRRREPRVLVDELLARFPLDEWVHQIEPGWLPYIFMQTGEWDLADDAIRRYRRRRMEGYERDAHLMTSGTLSWMRGDHEAAEAAVAELEQRGINPRWYHDFYPLRTDIAADARDVDAARRHAETHLAVEVDPSEEHRKLGTLHPLVRAETTAALASSGAERADHVSRAESAVARMHAILESYPPPSRGSVAMETQGTHLAFALAELSRVTGPDPDLWQEAADRADYVYFRLYARIRLAEALYLVGKVGDASELMDAARSEVTRLGASGLARLIGEIDPGDA